MCVLLSVRVRVCVWGFRSWRLGYKSDGMETLLHVAKEGNSLSYTTSNDIRLVLVFLSLYIFGGQTADRRQGNTGGLGGAFGFMWAVGKPLPIPECRPYKPSLRFRLLNFVGNLAQKMQAKK